MKQKEEERRKEIEKKAELLRQYRSQLEKEADIYDRLKNLKAGWTTEEAEG